MRGGGSVFIENPRKGGGGSQERRGGGRGQEGVRREPVGGGS